MHMHVLHTVILTSLHFRNHSIISSVKKRKTSKRDAILGPEDEVVSDIKRAGGKVREALSVMCVPFTVAV